MQQIYTNGQQKHTDRRQLYRILKTTRAIIIRKTPKETPKGKQDKNTSSPHPGPALKPATLEMIEKEKERKKKEKKDRIKQQQKEERRQQYHKEKEQAEKAHQNPYSALHKDDEVCMEEESVAHCQDYQ